jgi:hypothetical protein
MMRLLTDFRRMRFGLGVTLLTDGYFANDLGGRSHCTLLHAPCTVRTMHCTHHALYSPCTVCTTGGFYGVPSYYTEFETDLGQALADPVRVFPSPYTGKGATEEVWTREFEHGIVVVSSLSGSNFTLALPANISFRELPLSIAPERLTDTREAPAWQFVVDNGGVALTDFTRSMRLGAPVGQVDVSSTIPAQFPGRFQPPLGGANGNFGPNGSNGSNGSNGPLVGRPACECSAAAPACCKHDKGHPQDWWADDSRRARCVYGTIACMVQISLVSAVYTTCIPIRVYLLCTAHDAHSAVY